MSSLLPEMAEISAIIADEKGRVVIAPNCSTEKTDRCSPSLCSFVGMSGAARAKMAPQIDEGNGASRRKLEI
jgi:hypothetical protein